MAKFNINDRVEFKDSGNVFHIGYVKKLWRKRKLFGTQWSYDICELTKSPIRKVYTVPEMNIFGIAERKEKTSAPTKDQLDELQNKFYKY